MSRASRRRGTGRTLIAAAVVVAAGGAAVAATGFGLGGGGGTADDGGKLPPATAKVAKKTLLDRQANAGRLGYGTETSLSGRLDGTVTALPPVGARITRGKAFYRIDNKPVVLMYGKLPAFRALTVGTKGPDVRQFERNLWALGYRGFTVDGTFSSATATAVREWQDDLGLDETGTVEQGRVVYTPGPVRVNTQKAVPGDAARQGTALLTYTGLARVVTVKLSLTDQRLARFGAAVTAKLPSGKTMPGKITKVRTVVSGTGGDDASTKIEVSVTVADTKALNGLDQAVIDVAFTASQRKDVLTVPVGALLALSEGGYGVEVVQNGATRIVTVETGLFADGQVEVTGIAEGTTVGIPA